MHRARIGRRAIPTQKARPAQAALSATRKRGEEKMKKGEIIYIIYNARSVIRAAVCGSLDLYGIIITFNC